MATLEPWFIRNHKYNRIQTCITLLQSNDFISSRLWIENNHDAQWNSTIIHEDVEGA